MSFRFTRAHQSKDRDETREMLRALAVSQLVLHLHVFRQNTSFE